MRKIYDRNNNVVGMTSTPQPKKPSKSVLQSKRAKRMALGIEYDRNQKGFGEAFKSMHEEK